MSSTVSVAYKSMLTAIRTYTGQFVSAANATVTYSGLNTEATYNASSTYPVTKLASGYWTLDTGLFTADLTALTDEDGTVNLSALKVQFLKLRGKSTNANAITISEGGSNGYALLGASFTFKLLANQEVLIRLADASPDVAGGDKTIDLVGTGSQVLEWELLAG